MSAEDYETCDAVNTRLLKLREVKATATEMLGARVAVLVMSKEQAQEVVDKALAKEARHFRVPVCV